MIKWSYVNMAPVFFRLGETTEIAGSLNAKLLAGELDVAPISSIEYARNADRLRLLPGSASRPRAPSTRSSSSRASRSSRCGRSP